MFRTSDQEIQSTKLELQKCESELAELKEQLQLFEAQVDSRLGALLDQLSELNAETSLLDEKLRHIREKRLFGSDLMRYLEGAPLPARPTNLDNLPPDGLPLRSGAQPPTSFIIPDVSTQLPDIKSVYRRLARRYHPDLARSDTDRSRANDQMKLINQAYTSGDLRSLMQLAGMNYPFSLEIKQPPPAAAPQSDHPQSEIEMLKGKLRETRLEINRLGSLPVVKLSLDVKLARHQGRDLLHEMAGELVYKVARKTAERDYLRSQIDACDTQQTA